MTRYLGTFLIALIASTGLIAAACSSGGGDEQAANTNGGGDGDSVVANADSDAPDASDGSSDDAATPSDDDGSEDATDEVADDGESSTSAAVSSETVLRVESAAARTSALDSYAFDMEFGMEGIPDLPGAMTFTASGAIDLANQRMHMLMDMNSLFDVAAGTASEEELALMRALIGDGIIEFIGDGDTVYLHWSLFTSLFGAETKWVSFTDDSSDALGGFSGGLSFDQLGSGPDSFLAYIGGIGTIEEVGPAVTRGVETTHYAGLLDLQKSIEAADAAEAAELQQQLTELGVGTLGEVPVELWIDGDGYLRSFRMDFDFSSLGLGASAAELGAARMYVRSDFFDFGDAVSINIPSADEVTVLDGDSLFGGGF